MSRANKRLLITYFIGITKVSNSKSDLQTHSRSLAIMPFDRPYMISYYSSILTMSLSCIVYEISLIPEKLKTSRDRVHAHSRDRL